MKRIILIITTLLAFQSYAQQDLIMYGLQDIPQSSYSNPSNRFNGNFFIGLPALSSNYFSFSNSGFAYSDGIVKQGDSLLLDFDKILNNLEDKNYLSFNTKIDLLSFGISVGDKTQVTFNVTENASFRFNYPKDFMQFVFKGNASFDNSTADFDGLGFDLNHYREYGIGISRQITNKFRIGLRAKYLYGMENIYSEKADITLRTDPNTFEINANADILIRTAGIDDVDDDESGSEYATGRDNTGFGADLGFNYDLNDKLSINASLIDLGYINWNTYTNSHKNSGGQFSYSGIEINAFTNDDTSETSFDRVLDSLEEAFELTESDESYSAPLATRFYAGANYKLTERDLAGVVIQSEFFQGTIKPSFTLSYSRKMTKWITLASSYSVINSSYSNLGLGFSVDPGPVQFYIVSDNILGAFQPQNARHLQVRFGINLIFGRDKTTEIRPGYKGVIGNKSNNDTPTNDEAIEEEQVEEVIEESPIEEEAEKSDSTEVNIDSTSIEINTDSTAIGVDSSESIQSEPNITTDSSMVPDSTIIPDSNVPNDSTAIIKVDSSMTKPKASAPKTFIKEDIYGIDTIEKDASNEDNNSTEKPNSDSKKVEEQEKKATEQEEKNEEPQTP